MAVTKIALGFQDKLFAGNLNSKEIGGMPDYVRMMWLILQSDTPEDWVISTGKTTSIRDFVKIAFNI